jgi:hypothetical protein
MAWNVEYADAFEDWWNGLSEVEEDDIAVGIGLLETYGPALKRPYADRENGDTSTPEGSHLSSSCARSTLL